MYYIDTKIYFECELQPPRAVYCNDLEIIGDMATFYDIDGNEYVVSRYELYSTQEETRQALEIQTQIYNDNKNGVVKL